MPLDPRDAQLVLEAFEIRCPDCEGSGSVREGPDDYTCGRCSGTGYHLSGATRENWPWGFGTACDHCDYGGDCKDCPIDCWTPYMPDFPNDDAAAVKLVERLGPRSILQSLWPPWNTFDKWTVHIFDTEEVYESETLGDALLAALRAAREEQKS